MMVSTENLSRVYRMGQSEVRALQEVNVQVAAGEFVALMGASGSGKSTLLSLLGCLDRPTSGSYRLEGCEVTALSRDERARLRNRRIGFVFQSFNLLPRLSAVDNVALPLLYRRKTRMSQARAAAQRVLAQVGLEARAGHLPGELSGGERQRVAIARALVVDPALLLADEPTGNLDSASGAGIMGLLVELNRQGRTIIMVTHDAQIARRAHRTLYLHDGRIAGSNPKGLRDP